MVAIGDKVKYRSDGEIATVVAVHDGRTVGVKTEHWGICKEKIGGTVDIVSDGPVRTVTRHEIIPGTYDGVTVGYVTNVPDCDNPDAPVVQEVLVTIPPTHMTADELDRAAAVLTALAGALRDAS